jgi:excisionase family DNA binding protein
MTIEGTARHTGPGENTVRRLVRQGWLTGHRPTPGRVLIDKGELDALIKSSANAPGPAPGRGRKRKQADA